MSVEEFSHFWQRCMVRLEELKSEVISTEFWMMASFVVGLLMVPLSPSSLS